MKPAMQEFVFWELEKWVRSDEQLMNMYTSRYMKKCIIFWNWASISKKNESLRKYLSNLRKTGKIKESHRKNRKIANTNGCFESAEIFYKLK